MKGKNKKAEYEDGLPPGEVRMNPKSTYINTLLFVEWLKDHFIPRKPNGKVLLILDGHVSHMSSPDMLQHTESNDIILLYLPSHTTHYLQPLDHSFFKNFKHFWSDACNTFEFQNPGHKIN